MARKKKGAGCRPLMEPPAKGLLLNEQPFRDGEYNFFFYRNLEGEVVAYRYLQDDPYEREERAYVLKHMSEVAQKKFCEYCGVASIHDLRWNPQYETPPARPLWAGKEPAPVPIK